MSQPVADPAETIVAVATPSGSGARALVRVSGVAAIATVARLAEPASAAALECGGFSSVRLELTLSAGEQLEVWATVYRAPKSYTGEDMVELLVCGSPPVLAAIVRAVLTPPRGKAPGVRLAAPGEFTLRAFLSGRLELSQAEAVGDLIAAHGAAEAKAARRTLRGEFRACVDAIAGELLETVALVEAGLDFPDEDLPLLARASVAERVTSVREKVESLLKVCHRRARSASQLRVVLAGFPNAGKSSLLNAVAAQEAAIATPMAGTTRDPVRVFTRQHGRSVEWIDLAGFYDVRFFVGANAARHDRAVADDPVSDGVVFRGSSEHAGARDPSDAAIWRVVERLTRIELEDADVVLWVVDPSGSDGGAASLAEFDALSGAVREAVPVVQKSDLLTPSAAARWLREWRLERQRPSLVSAHTGDGIEALIDRVLHAPADRPRAASSARAEFLVSAHQEAKLQSTCAELVRAETALATDLGYEFVAAELRGGLDALSTLSGEVVSSDRILGQIFSRFCIGK